MPRRRCPRCGEPFARLDRHVGSAACRRAAAKRPGPSPGGEDGRADPPDPAMPDDLGEAGAALWAQVTDGYVIAGSHVARLEAACREADAANAAELAVLRDGRLVKDRYGGLRLHPGVGAARNARLAMSRLLAALNLQAEEAS